MVVFPEAPQGWRGLEGARGADIGAGEEGKAVPGQMMGSCQSGTCLGEAGGPSSAEVPKMWEPTRSSGSGDGADPRPHRLRHGLGLPGWRREGPRAMLRSSRAGRPRRAPGSTQL